MTRLAIQNDLINARHEETLESARRNVLGYMADGQSRTDAIRLEASALEWETGRDAVAWAADLRRVVTATPVKKARPVACCACATVTHDWRIRGGLFVCRACPDEAALKLSAEMDEAEDAPLWEEPYDVWASNR